MVGEGRDGFTDQLGVQFASPILSSKLSWGKSAGRKFPKPNKRVRGSDEISSLKRK